MGIPEVENMDACGLKLRWAQGKGLETEVGAALFGRTSGSLPVPVPCGLVFVLSPCTHTSLLRTLGFCDAESSLPRWRAAAEGSTRD